MSKRITMGNDEFILYIRKNNKNCELSNDQLGKSIWIWIRYNDVTAKQVKEDKECYWGKKGSFVDELKLPKTATQFEFNRKLLPDLYNYLDTLKGSVINENNYIMQNRISLLTAASEKAEEKNHSFNNK